MTENVYSLDCFAALPMTITPRLSLRDLCQQEVMDEKGSALAKVVAISILGSCESIQWLKFVVGYHFRLLRKRGSQ